MKRQNYNSSILVIWSASTPALASMFLKGKEFEYFYPVSKKTIKNKPVKYFFRLMQSLFYNSSRDKNILYRMDYYELKRKIDKGQYKTVIGFHSATSKPYLKYVSQKTSARVLAIMPSRLEEFDFFKNTSDNIDKNINYWVFGHRDAELMIKNGASKERIVVAGSPYSYLFLKSKIYDLNSSNNITFDICIVSQIIDDFFFVDKLTENRKKGFRTHKKILEEINLLDQRMSGIRVVVALRPQSKGGKYLKNEIDFFKTRLNVKELVFVENDQESFSTYRTMLASKIVLSGHSTAGFEAYGFHKIAWFYRPYIRYENNIIFSTESCKKGSLASDLFKVLANIDNYKKNLKFLKYEFNDVQPKFYDSLIESL
jgi:hypothetical protein